MGKTIAQPQNARSRRSRAALLDATRALIEEHGFDTLTMAAVAERAGMSRRAVYLHFATRAELATALYRRLAETEDIAASLQKVWDSPDAVTALDEWARHIARVHPKILPVMRAVERARHTDPDAAQLWETGQRGWLAGSRRLAGWLAREGQLAPPWTTGTAADMLWSLMSTDLLARLLHDRRWPPGRIGDYLAVVLIAAFTGQPEPGKSEVHPDAGHRRAVQGRARTGGWGPGGQNGASGAGLSAPSGRGRAGPAAALGIAALPRLAAASQSPRAG